MRLSRLAILAGILALAIFFGCTAVNIPDEEKFGSSTFTPAYTPDDELICQGMKVDKPCYCMFCENGLPWIPSLFPALSFMYDASLEGGRCSFEYCNKNSFEESLSSSDNTQARVVMLGNGPSFRSTDKANRYADYSLQLAVRWMTGVNAPPAVPNQSRAICWLQRNTLPVYIYYTDAKYMNPFRMTDIVREFNREDGTGPVILTTELIWNSSKQDQLQAVRRQIMALDNCEKCLKVLAIKSGDKEALDAILKDNSPYPGKNGEMKTLRQMIDLVGFGFRVNDYQNCSVEKVIGDNYEFSRMILRTYSKPTIWLYAGASEGKNVDGSCSWDANKVTNFYENLFAITQGMASSGIIGFSLYEFYDNTGPLPCNAVQGCSFGLMNSEGQKHPAINSWASLARYFGEDEYRSPLVFSRNSFGSQCDFMQNTKLFNAISYSINPPSSLLPDEDVQMVPKIAHLGCGEACVSNEPMDSAALATFDNVAEPYGIYCYNSNYCIDREGAPPEIASVVDEEADLADSADIAGTYMISLLQQRNTLIEDSWYRTCINSSIDDYNYFDFTMANICTLANRDPDNPLECSNLPCLSIPGEPPTPTKPKAFGISQCLEYPGPFYQVYNLPLPEDITQCGGYNYDPFKQSDSLCCATRKFKRYLEKAKIFISDNWVELHKCPYGLRGSEDSYNDIPWAEYFLATQMYNNETMKADGTIIDGEIPSLTEFIAQRDAGGSCAGIDNYASWITENVSKFSAQTMTRYLSGLVYCEIDCAGASSALAGCPDTG